MNIVTQPTLTPEDLLRMPEGDHYELVDGRLVEEQMSLWSSYVAGRTYFLLSQFNDAACLGWVLPDASYQCFPAGRVRVRRPDVSFLLLARMPVNQATEEGHIRVAPDLAVEVVSPNDLIYELDRKLLDYFDAGIPLVWVINPDARIVWVHHRGTIRLLRETDDLTGEDVLPGFRCPVRDLFVPPVPPADTP
jgi:Uma2 family endonuclease